MMTTKTAQLADAIIASRGSQAIRWTLDEASSARRNGRLDRSNAYISAAILLCWKQEMATTSPRPAKIIEARRPMSLTRVAILLSVILFWTVLIKAFGLLAV